MTDNREKVAADFRNEISHAFEPGAKVMSADRELRYCLELQRDRLEKRNLRYKDNIGTGCNTCVKCNPANLMSHYLNYKYTSV